jgi:hypothetical protein
LRSIVSGGNKKQLRKLLRVEKSVLRGSFAPHPMAAVWTELVFERAQTEGINDAAKGERTTCSFRKHLHAFVRNAPSVFLRASLVESR